MLTDQVGSLLRTARKTLGLTQAELARRANVSERLWAEVERGERPNVSLETALRMLSEVGVTVRLNDQRGISHELSDAETRGAARAARAAVRRVTWTGTQTTLERKGMPPEVAADGRLHAVGHVSEQAYAVARSVRSRKAKGG